MNSNLLQTHTMPRHSNEGLKAVYGHKSSGTSPINSSDNTLLTDRDTILKRWAEHFESILNRDAEVDNEVINDIPQRPVLQELSGVPSLAEVEAAIKQLSNGKAPGMDGIPAEIYKHGGSHLVSKLTNLFVIIWSEGSVPQDSKMLLSSASSRIKVVAHAVMTIVVSRC